MAKDEEYEVKEGLSGIQSNPQLNLEIFSDSRTAAPCGPNSETLTMSNEESLNTKVVELEVCLIWTPDEGVMVEILKAAEYGKLISGRIRTRTSSPSKRTSWMPKNPQDSCIYIEIGLLGLL